MYSYKYSYSWIISTMNHQVGGEGSSVIACGPTVGNGSGVYRV